MFSRKDFGGRGSLSLRGGLSRWRKGLRVRGRERAEGHISRLNRGVAGQFVARADRRSYDNNQGYNSIVPMGFRWTWDLRRVEHVPQPARPRSVFGLFRDGPGFLSVHEPEGLRVSDVRRGGENIRVLIVGGSFRFDIFKYMCSPKGLTLAPARR